MSLCSSPSGISVLGEKQYRLTRPIEPPLTHTKFTVIMLLSPTLRCCLLLGHVPGCRLSCDVAEGVDIKARNSSVCRKVQESVVVCEDMFAHLWRWRGIARVTLCFHLSIWIEFNKHVLVFKGPDFSLFSHPITVSFCNIYNLFQLFWPMLTSDAPKQKISLYKDFPLFSFLLLFREIWGSFPRLILWTFSKLRFEVKCQPAATEAQWSGQILTLLFETVIQLFQWIPPLGAWSLLHHYLTAKFGRFTIYFQLAPQVPTWIMLHSTSPA